VKNIFSFLLISMNLCFFEVCALITEDAPYERFISLGNCCVTRNQINNHLSQRFALDERAFGGGQLFDWLVIHDYNKLAEAIENKLIDLFDRNDLLLGPSWAGDAYPCVKNVRYLMTWNHLFTRQGNSISPHIIDLEYDIKKNQIDYLSKKFNELKNYRTLYIVAYPFIGNGILNTLEPDLKTLIRLRNALKKYRQNSNFTLLFCPLNKKFENSKNIVVQEITNPPDLPEYTGDFNCWDMLLSQFPFTTNKIEIDLTKLYKNDADAT
jgi:hypothetical protein